ncbi:Protein CBG11737 [Caenorhabditis briggsae]|uniref:Protein CBG11737 n=1 Tax=Caenorhabditis briggsae TaxID=6238 RepID=E3CU26_CAEBR|nr:Protein CBG11737 [Caenorhabditis briggsae]CBX33043.1 Protein CBG11737 [Caenorhabditis briggsae]
MSHLDDPSQLDAVFLNLGKIHAKHEEQLGFSAHYWSVFKECVLFHFRKAMKSHNKFTKHKEMSFAEIDSAIILWREVLRFIIDRMKVGYCESGAIRKSNKQAINGQHSISGEDSGVSFSVETKQDLTQVKTAKATKNRMASRHSLAVIRTNGINQDDSTSSPSTTTCNLLQTIASISPKCVRRRFSLSPRNTHV